MKIKGLIDEDFVNYRKSAMYIAFPSCTFKCDNDNHCKVCQNASLAKSPTLDVDKNKIIERYLDNPLTHAFVLSGLEPFDSAQDLLNFVQTIREVYQCQDDIVIYTGYTEDELRSAPLVDTFNQLCQYKNIIVKFGRFITNDTSHYDNILGVKLASQNQYAKQVGIES